MAHQAFGNYLVHWHAAKEDAGRRTGSKFHHGAFPASRRTYKSRQGVFGERDGYIMQHFLVLIGKRYVLNDTCSNRMSPASGDCRSPFISGSFIKDRIRPPAMEKYRNSVKLVSQGGSRRVKHTGTDYEKQHEHKDGKLSSQQQIRSGPFELSSVCVSLCQKKKMYPLPFAQI